MKTKPKEGKIKPNYKKMTRWEITEDNYILHWEEFRLPMFMFHLLRKIAILLDKMANKTRSVIFHFTDVKEDIDANFKFDGTKWLKP